MHFTAVQVLGESQVLAPELFTRAQVVAWLPRHKLTAEVKSSGHPVYVPRIPTHIKNTHIVCG